MVLNFENAYVASPFLQVLRDGDWAVIWHSLFGNPKIVSSDTLEVFKLFAKPDLLSNVFDANITEEERESLEELIRYYFLVPEGFDERALLKERQQTLELEVSDGSLINYLELIMSEECNFRCSYCIHFSNTEKSTRSKNAKKFMQYDVAKEAVDRYVEILAIHNKRTAEINFGGGEPLLAWSVIKQVISYCHDFYGSKFDFHFSINTNASLITDDIARILKQYRVEVASSLDGLYEGNDSVRLTNSGDGTFVQIVNRFNLLERAGHPLSGIAVTVNEKNFNHLNESLIEWAASRGMKDVRIDLDVVGMVDIRIEDIVVKLMSIRRYAATRGIDVPGFWSRPAENLNEFAFNNVAFCGAVRGNSVCVSPSGEIYACGYSTMRLGTLQEINSLCVLDGLYSQLVRSRFTGVMEMCRGCAIEGQCGGGCHITHEFSKKVKTTKLERMCDFYRLMTKEILKEQLREATK